MYLCRSYLRTLLGKYQLNYSKNVIWLSHYQNTGPILGIENREFGYIKSIWGSWQTLMPAWRFDITERQKVLVSKRKKQGETIEIIQKRCGALNELIFVLMLQLACSKNYGKVSSEDLAELFFREAIFCVIKWHESYRTTWNGPFRENPREDPDPDLQVISLN